LRFFGPPKSRHEKTECANRKFIVCGVKIFCGGSEKISALTAALMNFLMRQTQKISRVVDGTQCERSCMRTACT